MARPRTTKKTAKAAPPAGQRLISWIFRPWRLVAAASLALVWLLWPQVEEQLPKLDNRPEYQVTADQITISPPPRWVPPDLVQKVFDRAGFEGSLSVLDPNLSEKVALAFYTHPWVERLKKVSKSFPARVHVEVVYRQPVAMVEVLGGGYYPIDRNGFLLPIEDFTAADVGRYPTVKNVSSVPMGHAGEAWGDPAVLGAAQLAAVLTEPNESGQSWWNVLGLKSILTPKRLSASDAVDDLQFRIETAGGSQIVWGRGPATAHPGELSVAQKLGRLAEYHHRYNGFDDAPAPFLIDIRPWDGAKRSLLASEQPSTQRQ
ncbi:MAG: hypothetical protein KDA81_20445 [Planctomycetaceae bacterium]|nr:hypothetical protein [Planctomycetaceae bacterium]